MAKKKQPHKSGVEREHRKHGRAANEKKKKTKGLRGVGKRRGGTGVKKGEVKRKKEKRWVAKMTPMN